MKTILFSLLLIVLLFTAESVLSVDTGSLSKDELHHLKAALLLLLACLAGVMLMGKRIFRKYVR